MTIDDKMKQRLSAFTRRWNSMRAQLGHMLDSATTEIKETPPPARMSSRARRSYDEASVIRVPNMSPEEAEWAARVAEVLHAAWENGEAHVSIGSLRGHKPALRDTTARQRDPNVVPGPHSEQEQDGMAQGPAASFMPKKPDEPVPGGVVYDPKTDTIRKTD